VPKILRFPDAFGPRGKIPVGHTKAYDDFIYRPGGDEFIPGTNIPRARRIPLGPRAIGFDDHAIDEIADGLIALSKTNQNTAAE
jgi:hypothetical protein